MSKPTVVLVHGPFADASSWRPVFELLDADEYPMLAPPNPLRGVAHDAAYIKAVIDQLDGPVVLVGYELRQTTHSFKETEHVQDNPDHRHQQRLWA